EFDAGVVGLDRRHSLQDEPGNSEQSGENAHGMTLTAGGGFIPRVYAAPPTHATFQWARAGRRSILGMQSLWEGIEVSDAINQRLSQISTRWSLIFEAHKEAEGDKAAAQLELVQRYCGAIYNYLLGVLRDPNVVDEL